MPCERDENGVKRCGLLQTPNGSTFDASDVASSIYRMLREGDIPQPFARSQTDNDVFAQNLANRLIGWNGWGSRLRQCQT